MWAQDNVKNYSLTIYYFEELTEEERDSMFYRLNNGKPLTPIELTRVKAKSLGKFQELAKHELVNLSVTEKGRTRYNHENLTIQAWAVCYVPDVSFETKVFRGIVENADVEQNHVDKINACFDVLLDIYNSYADDKTDKKMKKRILTRTHTVALTKAAFIAIECGYDMEQFIEWAKMFYSGTEGPSINEAYNISCGAGSARKDRVTARLGAIVDNMTEFYIDEEQASDETDNEFHDGSVEYYNTDDNSYEGELVDDETDNYSQNEEQAYEEADNDSHNEEWVENNHDNS
jgi:hypothetical protein